MGDRARFAFLAVTVRLMSSWNKNGMSSTFTFRSFPFTIPYHRRPKGYTQLQYLRLPHFLTSTPRHYLPLNLQHSSSSWRSSTDRCLQSNSRTAIYSSTTPTESSSVRHTPRSVAHSNFLAHRLLPRKGVPRILSDKLLLSCSEAV